MKADPESSCSGGFAAAPLLAWCLSRHGIWIAVIVVLWNSALAPKVFAQATTTGGQTPHSALPWSDGNDASVPEALQLLELYGVSSGDLTALAQNGWQREPGLGVLLRVLYHVVRFGPDQWQQWRGKSDALEEYLPDSENKRGRPLFVRGTITQVKVHSTPEKHRETLEFDRYFEVHLRPRDSRATVICYCRSIPQQWLMVEQWQQPAEIDGLFLKSDSDGDQSTVYVAADRVAWYPRSASQQPKVRPSDVLLASQHVDIGRFDDLSARNGKPLDGHDRELFYQLLQAIKRLDLATVAHEGLPLAATLTRPQQHHGEVYRFYAQARRITKIVVSDMDVSDRFGVTHYYQIDAVLPLDQQQIRLQLSGGKDVVYADRFPFTFCAADLPEALQQLAQPSAAHQAVAPLLNERVELTGVFFKIWPYRSEYVAAVDADQLHPSPLFLGTIDLAPRAAPARDSVVGIVVASSFAGALLIGALLLWRFHRAQRIRLRQLRQLDTAERQPFQRDKTQGTANS